MKSHQLHFQVWINSSSLEMEAIKTISIFFALIVGKLKVNWIFVRSFGLNKIFGYSVEVFSPNKIKYNVLIACYAGAPSYKPVPIRPCLDYVNGGTAASKKWSNVANGILENANAKWLTTNETLWNSPRAEFVAAMDVIKTEALEQTKAEYWVACNDMAAVFSDSPYHIYDLFENLKALPKPYNCIKGICQSVFNTRETTLEQIGITYSLYVEFFDEAHAP